ncbi:hypothetical protein, partial [Promicromonospora kroppenstedtii]|uniref:hypothetical protein n=1 Tax=Promicromonospora kroppenstedtii TaxID=440482 RepID=UPI00056278BD
MSRPSLSAAVSGGSHRASLEALRDYLADALDQTDTPPATQTPPLRPTAFRPVLAELAEMD